MGWCIFFPGMTMKDMKVIWDISNFPVHILCTSESSESLEMSVAKKNILVFPIRQAGLVKPSLQPAVALFQSSCQWRCSLQGLHNKGCTNLQGAQEMVQIISALLAFHTGAICYPPDVTGRLRMSLCCAAWFASELAKPFRECDSRVVLKDALQRGESFFSWDPCQWIAWTDSWLEERKSGGLESAQYSLVVHRYYLPLLVSPWTNDCST